MYSFEEKERIIELLKTGTSIEEIHNTYGIPMNTLNEWQGETIIRKKIKMLRAEGKLDEAEQEVENLTGEHTEQIKRSIQIGIVKARKERAKRRGNLTEENLYRQKQKELLEEQIKKQPNDTMAISSLIAIAKEEKDKGREKILLYRLIQFEPDNIKVILELIRIAISEGDMQEIRRLQRILLDIDSENKKILKMLNKNGIEVNPETPETIQLPEIETLNLSEEEETPIQKARRLIYESEDIEKGAEEIKEILEGQPPTDVAIVLAELYFHLGMTERAEKHLKAYKKTLDKTTNAGDIRFVNQVMELARNKKTPEYKWKEFWVAKQGIENIVTVPSYPVNDDRER